MTTHQIINLRMTHTKLVSFVDMQMTHQASHRVGQVGWDWLGMVRLVGIHWIGMDWLGLVGLVGIGWDWLGLVGLVEIFWIGWVGWELDSVMYRIGFSNVLNWIQ